MDLQIPIDFERLPEFRMLCSELEAQLARANVPAGSVNRAAVYVFMRLWVELAYAAQVTNRPGLLTQRGAELYEQSLEPMFSDDYPVTKALQESGCLRPEGEGWICERFAKLNGHLAGNFKSKEVRGAAASALQRNTNRIAHEAMQQSMLLPPSLFKTRDGKPMSEREVHRCMVVIKTLDNCLKVQGRTSTQYTEGIISDAAAAADAHSAEHLRDFYVWLSIHREHVALPKTTEQILAEFEKYFPLSRE